MPRAAALVLGELLSGVPGLRILATSRRPLGLDSERVLVVSPLAVPIGSDPDAVRASAAGRLFIARATAALPSFQLDDESARSVAQICASLDGLPLALELAAARVRSLDLPALAVTLRERPVTLDRLTGPGRHRSLTAAIEWSWRLLDDAERLLLSKLAVLPGEFTLPLAEAVAAGADGREIRSVLTRLVDQSLVSAQLGGGKLARYRLLAVIRAFVLERVPAEVATASSRALARYLQAAAEPGMGIDEANLAAALLWAAENDQDLAGQLLMLTCRLTQTEPTRPMLELIREVSCRGPLRWGCEVLARASMNLLYLSLDDAERLAAESGRAAVTDRDRALAALAAGWCRAYGQDEPEAARHLELAISYAERAGDPWLAASALQARGVSRADPAEAFADWELAVPLFAAAGDLTHASNVRYMLASLAVETGSRMADVPVWLEACESFALDHGLRHELAHARLVRAGHELARHKVGVARDLLEWALPEFRRAGDFRCVARTLQSLAEPALTGDPAAAVSLLLESLRAAMISSGPGQIARVLTSLITSALAAGDTALAARCLGALEQQGTGASLGESAAPASWAPLRRPSHATFVSEGRAGGIRVIAAMGTMSDRAGAVRGEGGGVAARRHPG